MIARAHVAALLFGAALAIGALVPTTTLAQDAEHAEYRPTVDAALAEFDAGRFAEARALFSRAHALFPNARTLRGIGMASFELRDYPAALEALDGALASTTRALTDEQREQVTALRDRARVFVGRYEVAVMPEGTELYVDAVRTALGGGWPAAPGSIVLGIGEHTIEARLAGQPPSVARVVVRGGEEEALGLTVTETRAEPEPEPLVLETRTPEAPRSRGVDPAPWVLVGGGGAMVIAGIVLVVVGVGDQQTVQSAPRSTEWSSISDAYGRAPVLQGVGGALLGVGAALATVGVVWAVAFAPSTSDVEGTARSASTLADVELTVGPAYLGARGRW